jgi:hypothetical protein
VSDLERIRTDRVLGRRPPAPDPVLTAVRSRWAEIVGDAVARNAAPARTAGGALVVACSSAAWSAELALLATAIAARVREVAGLELDLRFEVGEVATPQDPAPRRPPPLSPEAASEARTIVADVAPDDLRASLQRAIARTLRG